MKNIGDGHGPQVTVRRGAQGEKPFAVQWRSSLMGAPAFNQFDTVSEVAETIAVVIGGERPDQTARAQMQRDTAALALIADELDGRVWSPDTLDTIRRIVLSTGRKVREPEEVG